MQFKIRCAYVMARSPETLNVHLPPIGCGAVKDQGSGLPRPLYRRTALPTDARRWQVVGFRRPSFCVVEHREASPGCGVDKLLARRRCRDAEPTQFLAERRWMDAVTLDTSTTLVVTLRNEALPIDIFAAQSALEDHIGIASFGY